MQKAILVFALSLNTKNNPFVQNRWLEVFVEKILLSHLKNTYNGCHGNQNVSFDQALDKLSGKFNSRLLVQEEHGFQKGAHCASLATGDQKKKKALPG